MAPSFWGPEFPPQPAAVFDDLAPVEAEEEEEDAYEDEMEEEEEDEHGSDGEVVPMDTEDSGEELVYSGCGCNMLTLSFPGAVHIFMSASPDKVSQVEAALSLQGRLDPADSTTAPPASRNTLTMTFRGEECNFDSVTPDEVQDVLLSLAGRELMVPRIELIMGFPNWSYEFDSVSPDKLQAVLSLLGGMKLTVYTAVPCALHDQLTEPLMCWIDVLHPALPDKVEALLSLLRGNELNPGIGGGASPSIPYRLFLQSINNVW
ncbi:GATA transcription factor 20-like [Triticum dicoccoides]|uniref:GATA transcription factor 20-like n=1 Tax=Triticum dicoccoides TaxID=85692 RepID=UPI0018911398|nr:GATA transcription factor 20-like [Triticum dicoccoides]XP_037463871.1 GATA transcription factor 20-like [Triticum dicoccoides]XP_037463872.1 GATA transcription factor 20-like [Triticum dicoccoides]XP_037463873.1 GATA transcription factor 20-like [Triticum dicoccoides]XP_037463874.1 GATA transcription factor 20-like [Triticum dicoccoides]